MTVSTDPTKLNSILPYAMNCINSSRYDVPCLLYILPRTFRYLTTKPHNEDTSFNRFRKEANSYANIFIESIGKTNWDLFMALAIDNAWISHILISPLDIKTNELNVKKVILIGLTYLGVGSSIWIVQLALTKILKRMKIDDIKSIKPRTES